MNNKKREIILIACILGLTLASMTIITFIQGLESGDWLKYALPLCQIIVACLAILCIYSIRQVDKINKDNIKNQFQKTHYQEIETLLIASRVERHEYRKHLQALQSCLHLGLLEEAVHYLDGISNQTDSEEYLAIDHPSLFGLVNSKYALARTQGIEMGVSVECDLSNLNVEPWDLCSMVGNLLDNALEAAAFDKEVPRVGLEFRNWGGDFEITVTNNGRTVSQHDMERVFEAGFSTKESTGRGYGMYIVKNLVENYQGKIELSSDSKTVTKIILPEDGHGRENIEENSSISGREIPG